MTLKTADKILMFVAAFTFVCVIAKPSVGLAVLLGIGMLAL